ncbi:MAG: hypothetical protein STSR0008_08190 [Ignavibacterium sp.]
MKKKISTFRLGIFVFIGLVLLFIIVFLVGERQSMFSNTMQIKATFGNIEGLRIGAPVRLSGINVGSVTNIQMKSDTSGKVDVEMRIESDVSRFLRANTKATIQTEGLVGNQFIILIISQSPAPKITGGDYIEGIDPLGFSAVLEETQNTLENTREMTQYLSEIVAKVNEGEGSVGKLINDDDLYNSANNLVLTADKSLTTLTTNLDTLIFVVNSIGTEVETFLNDIDKAVVEINSVVTSARSGKGVLGNLIMENSQIDTTVKAILKNFVEISEETKLSAARLAENMEALKHNWLFKSYFEQRGYYDKPGYEKRLDDYLDEVNERINILDRKINELKQLEQK